MADITDQLQFANTAPNEAVQNIDNARLFDMTPDAYKESQDVLQPDADRFKLNSTVTKGVAEYGSLSSQHASLIKNDTFKLSQVENLFARGKEKIDGVDLNQQIQDLKIKQTADPAAFSEDDAAKLYILEDDVQTRKQFNIDKPGIHDELINKYFEKQKDVSLLDASMNSIGGGLASALGTTAQIPSLLYDAYFYPANLIRNLKGEPEIKAPDSLTNNPVAKHYNEVARQFNAQVPELNKNITDAISNGDFVQAGEIAALKFLNNFPNQALLIASSVAGGPEVGLAFAGLTTAAQSNAENQAGGIQPSQSIPNSLGKGVIEGYFEKFGTLGLLHTWEHALTNSYGKDAASKVILNTVKAIAHSTLGEATEEGLTSGAQDLTDYVSGVNPKALQGIGQRAAEAAIVGGFSGGLLTGPSAVIKAASNIQQYGVVQDNARKAVDLLNFDNNLTNSLEILKQTDLANLSKPESAQFLKTIFKGLGLDHVYLDKESLKNWANTPEKALAVRNIINPSGEAAAAMNAPIQVPAHEFFPLTFDFPDIKDQYKLSPEAASIEQAKTYLASVNDANQKRQDIFKKLETPNQTPQDVQMIKEALSPTQPNESDILNEDSYLDQTRMKAALKGLMSESEIPSFLAAQDKAKQSIVDNINETAQYEMEKVVDVGTTEALAFEKEAQLQRIENNPNIDIVEKFVNPQTLPTDPILQSLEGFSQSHAKPGFSPLAIDPSSLNESQKEFKKNEQLKKNKVFVKGGININDAAALLGFSTGEELLTTLATTPNRQDIAEQRTQARKVEIEQEVRDQVGLNELGISKAYNARLDNAVATMLVMKDKFWAQTKKGFKRIALTPPTSATLKNEAREAVAKSKVGDLNVNQFKVGERKSERIAWDAATNNEVEKAYLNQKAVAKNIALAYQTQLAIGQVNKIVRLARKFNKASIIQELKDAGPLYLAAANEILQNFNLTKRKSDIAEKEAFNKWSEKVAKEGQGNYSIPDRLKDQRASLNEMTVEQVLAAGDALQAILHTAKFKNKLFRKHEHLKSLETVTNIGNLVEAAASKVFDYNINKSETFQDVGFLEKKGEQLLNLKTYLERSQHLLVKLDDGKPAGLFNSLFWRPLVDASNAKKTLLEETEKHLNNIVEAFGKKEFENMSNEIVHIEEFKDFPGFRSGDFSKSQLFAMELNFGNEGNIVELEKFGVKRDVIRKVLDRELTDKHTALAQNIWNIFKSFQPKMQELQKRTEGVDNVIWVEGKAFEARGKQYPGGYYPISRVLDKVKVAAKKAQGAGAMSQIENFKLKYYGDAMTEQGHLESRTGNDDYLNLELSKTPRALNQIIHDLTHREVLADGVKLLADKKIRDNIAAVIGKDGYKNLVGTYISTAEEVENDSYGDNPLLKALNYFGQGFQIVAIGGKINSILVQPASLFLALDKMGKAESLPYFLKTVNHLTSNPHLIPAFYKFAEELNPAMREFTEDITKNSATGLNAIFPSKNVPIISPLKAASNFATDSAFRTLAEMDRLNKVIVTLTAYQMAIEGKAKGLENLKANHNEAAKYASNISELTQTHNDIRNLPPVQKNKYLKPYTYFYSDLNNLFNNSVAANREVRKQVTSKNYWNATTAAVGFTLTLTLLTMYENSIRGQLLPGDDDEEKGFVPALKAWGKFLLWQPITAIGNTLPFVRDVFFAANKKGAKRKDVQLPLESGLSEIATAIPTLLGYLDFVNAHKDLSSAQRKSLWLSGGILFHMPTGAVYDMFIREKRNSEYLKSGLLDRLSKVTKSIIENPNIENTFKSDLEKLDAKLNPKVVDIPSQTYTVVKEMLSDSNPTLYNDKTGASGIYQFTEDTWNSLMQDAPQLGLTESGRVSQKTEQQQRAFEYTSKQSSTFLKAAGLESTPENLYGSQLFGPLKLIEILSNKDSVKLSALVEDKLLVAYDIKKDLTIGGFKDWLLFKFAEAEDRLTNKPKSGG